MSRVYPLEVRNEILRLLAQGMRPKAVAERVGVLQRYVYQVKRAGPPAVAGERGREADYLIPSVALTWDEAEWTADAVCASVDPELFFPQKGGTTAPAKQICQGCPVKAECLDWAVQLNMRFGIWGGLSERERRKIERGVA